jgi:hypothetical protein
MKKLVLVWILIDIWLLPSDTFAQLPLNISLSQSSYTTCITSSLPKFSKPVTLTAYGADSFTWTPAPNPPASPNSSVIVVTPSVSTCYTVIGSAGTSTGSAIACFTVIQQFSVTTGPNPFTVCYLQDANLSIASTSSLAAGPSSAFTYSWDFSPATASVSGVSASSVTVFQPTAAVNYTVQVTDALACLSSPAQGTVLVDPSCFAGLENKKPETVMVSVYPNPAKNTLFIEAEMVLPPEWSIEVSDITGRLVLLKQPQRLANESRYELGLEELKPGLYTYSLRSQQKLLQTGKFVKTD